jgi:hypothetical protein
VTNKWDPNSIGDSVSFDQKFGEKTVNLHRNPYRFSPNKLTQKKLHKTMSEYQTPLVK